MAKGGAKNSPGLVDVVLFFGLQLAMKLLY